MILQPNLRLAIARRPVLFIDPAWIERLLARFAHLKRSASTGHLLKNSAGHLATSCGGISPEDCDDLPGTSIDVEFSGVTLCTGCVDNIVEFNTTDLNGAFNVPHFSSGAGGHRYFLSNLDASAPSTNYDHYDSTPCAGTPTNVDDPSDIDIIVRGTGGNCYIFASHVDNMFDGNAASPQEVDQPSTNTWGSGDCEEFLWAYGGEVVLTAINP